jgi:sporulation protein YlmC with PRC-barrel domain
MLRRGLPWIAAAVCVAASAWGQTGDAPRDRNERRDAQQAAGREQQQAGKDRHYDAKQVSDMLRDMKNSLADSIKTAEGSARGKAVSAYCRMDAGAAPHSHVCVVTVFTGDNRLVEVTVDNQTNTVVSQREVQHLGMGDAFARADTGRSAERRERGDSMGRHKAGFDPPRRYQKATDLTTKEVKNAAGESLGRIENLVVDADSGRILYAVLSFGGVLGIGDKLFAIPWESLELPSDARHFVLAVEKERLRNAEGFDKDKWPNMADERWATQTHTFYGRTPYWAERGDRGEGDNMDRERREDGWNRPVRIWQKSSDLVGKNVKNPQGEDLGRMADLAIDPDAGRVIYGVVSSGDKYVAVPYGALDLSGGAEHFVLNITNQRLKEIPGFPRDHWPNLVDPTWADQAHRTFEQEPYWSRR